MFRLIDNNEVAVDSWQGFRCTVAEYSQLNAFGESNTAHRITQVLSGAFVAFMSGVYSATQIQSRELTFNVSIGNVVNIDQMTIYMESQSLVIFAIHDNFIPNTIGFQNYEISGIPNSNFFGFNLVIAANKAYDVSVPRTFDFFGEFALVDSLNNIYMTPDFDFENVGEKIENRHRVRSGEEYVYTWGKFKKFNMGVSFVDSGFKSIVNSYWSNNTELLLVQSGDMDISSVRFANNELPVGELIKPYTDLFKGTISLETY